MASLAATRVAMAPVAASPATPAFVEPAAPVFAEPTAPVVAQSPRVPTPIQTKNNRNFDRPPMPVPNRSAAARYQPHVSSASVQAPMAPTGGQYGTSSTVGYEPTNYEDDSAAYAPKKSNAGLVVGFLPRLFSPPPQAPQACTSRWAARKAKRPARRFRRAPYRHAQLAGASPVKEEAAAAKETDKSAQADKPLEAKAADPKDETKKAEAKALEAKPAEGKPAEGKALEAKAAEKKTEKPVLSNEATLSAADIAAATDKQPAAPTAAAVAKPAESRLPNRPQSPPAAERIGACLKTSRRKSRTAPARLVADIWQEPLPTLARAVANIGKKDRHVRRSHAAIALDSSVAARGKP